MAGYCTFLIYHSRNPSSSTLYTNLRRALGATRKKKRDRDRERRDAQYFSFPQASWSIMTSTAGIS